MSKHKRTREQKKIADLRRQIYYSLGKDHVSTFEINHPKEKENKFRSSVLINAYPFLARDILKIGILTATILTLQVILFFLLKKHIITLPNISY